MKGCFWPRFDTFSMGIMIHDKVIIICPPILRETHGHHLSLKYDPSLHHLPDSFIDL